MTIRIEAYRCEHEPAVHEFNQRLLAGGAGLDVIFHPKPDWLPPGSGRSLYNEYFVAIEGSVVRGGYALKHQDFSFRTGDIRSITYYHHPVSEGIVNKSFAPVGGLLLRDALRRAPSLYCLGMGGYDRALPKILVRQRWSHYLIPFFFRVVNARKFLREIQLLRTSTWRRLLMDLLGSTGVGSVAVEALRRIAWMRSRLLAPFAVEPVQEFSDWVDPLWNAGRGAHAMTAVRDSKTLRVLYPRTDQHLARLRLIRDGKDIGWAVVGERRKDPRYGCLRVGSIVDCWAGEENACAVIGAATRALEDRGMDLIVTNQSYHTWCKAVRVNGFRQGPSNFIFAASKDLARLLEPFEETRQQMHFTRADGDGLPRNF